MLTSSRQLLPAGLHRGAVLGVPLLLVTRAAQPPVGVRVRKVRHTVVPHALRVVAHLLHESWIPGLFMLAAWGQVAALQHRGAELRVVLLLVTRAAQPPASVRVGKVGHTVVPHALGVLPSRLPLIRSRGRTGTLDARGQRHGDQWRSPQPGPCGPNRWAPRWGRLYLHLSHGAI